MSIGLHHLTDTQVIGCNYRAISDARRKDPDCEQKHQIVRRGDLLSALGSIFYEDSKQGYVNLPIEKMAGLILHRIAEGQFFLDGNKRTALLSCFYFLQNNGYTLRIDQGKINDLLWEFGLDPLTQKRKYTEDDAIQYIMDNIMPRTRA